MRRPSRILLSLLSALTLSACSPQDSPAKINEKAIRSVIQQYQEAYNQEDATKLAALWASDSTYINPVTGETVEGRESIQKMFKQRFDDGKKRHVDIAVKSLDFPSDVEAVDHSVMKISIDGQPAHQVAYKADYIKENGQWVVKAISEISLVEPASNYEQLKDLEWLVGRWEDSDDNISITFDTVWDKYKNFITQHFHMKVHEQDDIEGQQIITWDSVKDQIRSWVFDSDGEFGEGTWEKIGDSWYATMRYTMNDGRLATSKNVYTPVDSRSYTFASIEREVDGEILPNLDTVTIEKSE